MTQARRLQQSTVSPPTSSGTWIGAHRQVTTDTQQGFAGWQAAPANQGAWTIGRTFSSDLPSTLPQKALDYYQSGYIAWHSVKSNWAATANGDFDAEYTSLAQSFPTSGLPGFLTVWHEPENDLDSATGMAATDFSAMYRHLYPIIKEANPNVQFGPIYGAYQWQPNKTATANPADWFPGANYCDFVSNDCYWGLYQGAPAMLYNDPGFARWFDFMSSKSVQLAISEFGYNPGTAYDPPLDNQVRGDAIAATAQFALDNNFKALLYWDSDTGGGGTAGTASWQLDTEQYAVDTYHTISLQSRLS